MLNILDVEPKYTKRPTEPLRRAAENLRQVAQIVAAQGKTAGQIRNAYISRVLGTTARPPNPLDTFKFAIKSKIAAQYGSLKGPSQDAREQLDALARRALQAGYSLSSVQVQDAFVSFIMSFVTDGFTGEDVTGTQIGRFQGEWRGGSFGGSNK